MRASMYSCSRANPCRSRYTASKLAAKYTDAAISETDAGSSTSPSTQSPSTSAFCVSFNA